MEEPLRVDEETFQENWKGMFIQEEYELVKEPHAKMLQDTRAKRNLDSMQTYDWMQGSTALQEDIGNWNSRGSFRCSTPIFCFSKSSKAEAKIDEAKGQVPEQYLLKTNLKDYVGRKAWSEEITKYSLWFDKSMEGMVPSDVSSLFQKKKQEQLLQGYDDVRLYRWDCDFGCRSDEKLKRHIFDVHGFSWWSITEFFDEDRSNLKEVKKAKSEELAKVIKSNDKENHEFHDDTENVESEDDEQTKSLATEDEDGTEEEFQNTGLELLEFLLNEQLMFETTDITKIAEKPGLQDIIIAKDQLRFQAWQRGICSQEKSTIAEENWAEMNEIFQGMMTEKQYVDCTSLTVNWRNRSQETQLNQWQDMLDHLKDDHEIRNNVRKAMAEVDVKQDKVSNMLANIQGQLTKMLPADFEVIHHCEVEHENEIVIEEGVMIQNILIPFLLLAAIPANKRKLYEKISELIQKLVNNGGLITYPYQELYKAVKKIHMEVGDKIEDVPKKKAFHSEAEMQIIIKNAQGSTNFIKVEDRKICWHCGKMSCFEENKKQNKRSWKKDEVIYCKFGKSKYNFKPIKAQMISRNQNPVVQKELSNNKKVKKAEIKSENLKEELIESTLELKSDKENE